MKCADQQRNKVRKGETNCREMPPCARAKEKSHQIPSTYSSANMPTAYARDHAHLTHGTYPPDKQTAILPSLSQRVASFNSAFTASASAGSSCASRRR